MLDRVGLTAIAMLLAVPAIAAERQFVAGALGSFNKHARLAISPRSPARNMTGPSLAFILGRKAGGLPSFRRYSPALKSFGVTWSEQTLDQWLADPSAIYRARSIHCVPLKRGASTIKNHPGCPG